MGYILRKIVFFIVVIVGIFFLLPCALIWISDGFPAMLAWIGRYDVLSVGNFLSAIGLWDVLISLGVAVVILIILSLLNIFLTAKAQKRIVKWSAAVISFISTLLLLSQ